MRHEEGAGRSTLTLRKVRAVIELRHEEGAGHSALTLRKVRAVFELRHEDAAAHSTLTLNKSVDVHTLDDHPGGWHTNRVSWRAILVSHLAISCRDPKRFGPAVWASDSDARRVPDAAR